MKEQPIDLLILDPRPQKVISPDIRDHLRHRICLHCEYWHNHSNNYVTGRIGLCLEVARMNYVKVAPRTSYKFGCNLWKQREVTVEQLFEMRGKKRRSKVDIRTILRSMGDRNI